MTAPTTRAEVRPALTLANTAPPWLMVVIAVFTIQFGSALAKELFDVVGFTGVVAIRTIFGAAIYILLGRPRLLGHSAETYRYAVLYGIAITANMLLFYAAIERIPLGNEVAIAFAGPLSMSVVGSRRALDLLWVAMAVIGIFLLSPITDTSIDPLGALLALGCAFAWAALILVMKRSGGLLPGNGMLTLAMVIAAVLAAPFGAVQALGIFASPSLLALGLMVTLLSVVIPLYLESTALKRLSSRTFGLLMSLEPAAATLIGWLILREDLGIESIIGIALVTIAAAGTTRNER